MVTKRYVKKAYILEAYCDKCGSEMISSEVVYDTYPEQYPYHCSNPNCDGRAVFTAHERPGQLQYEFEEVKKPSVHEFAIMQAKNKIEPVRLERKLSIPDELCPYCNAVLEYDMVRRPMSKVNIIYECPNGCKLTFQESNKFFENGSFESMVSYAEVANV